VLVFVLGGFFVFFGLMGLVMRAVMLGMELAGFGGMMRGMGVMAMRDLGVVRGLLDMLLAMLRRGVAVMLGRLLVMMRGVIVMLGDPFFVRHDGSSDWARTGCPPPRHRRIEWRSRCRSVTGS
jgi:hypothetical protein